MQDAQETKKEYIIQPEGSAFRLHSEYQATGDQPEAILVASDA